MIHPIQKNSVELLREPKRKGIMISFDLLNNKIKKN